MIDKQSISEARFSKGKFRRLLQAMGACKEGITFQTGKNLDEAWATCENGSFMSWWVSKIYNENIDPEASRVLNIINNLSDVFVPGHENNSAQRELWELRRAQAIRKYFSVYGTVKSGVRF